MSAFKITEAILMHIGSHYKLHKETAFVGKIKKQASQYKNNDI